MATSSGKSVWQTRRHDNNVAALGFDDFGAGKYLKRAVEDIEHFGGVIVSMRTRTIGILLERNLHGGESAARGVAIHQEFDLRGLLANDFRLMTVDMDRVLLIGENNGHPVSLSWIRRAEQCQDCASQ